MLTAAIVSSLLAAGFLVWNARISRQRDAASTGEERMERDLAGCLAVVGFLVSACVALACWVMAGMDARYGQ